MSIADPAADMLCMSISSFTFITESLELVDLLFLFFDIVQCRTVISVQILSHTSCWHENCETPCVWYQEAFNPLILPVTSSGRYSSSHIQPESTESSHYTEWCTKSQLTLTGLYMPMYLNILPHSLLLVVQFCLTWQLLTIWTVERAVNVGFCGQQCTYYRPYCLTARIRSTSSFVSLLSGFHTGKGH